MRAAGPVRLRRPKPDPHARPRRNKHKVAASAVVLANATWSSTSAVLAALRSSASGLSATAAAERLQQHGPNALPVRVPKLLDIVLHEVRNAHPGRCRR